ncbi:tyrosine-type recombinase/integrase [Pseudomonas kurunegalensis]|uniref:tyrosine-type recombinase/integrase n=1 Tax=Pseudomonas kurunegalensis TaxID=485880 RepID=UPI0023632C53|nr:site-specific integrase [Pseudomonas kurunegalensis]MDD2134619.1 site-specific integrase [Pseudomonas kurunegalensis]
MADLTKQLFSLIDTVELHGYYARGKAYRKIVQGLSHLSWPNGRPCNEANLYMLSLLRRPGRGHGGLTTSGSKGGTVGESASKISQIIRYCYKRGLQLHELVDGDFSDFIDELRKEEVGAAGVLKKTEDRITVVGRECIKFLEYVGRLHGVDQYVGEEGIIKAFEREYRIESHGKQKVIYYWYHSSFSVGDRQKKRNPISRKNIKDLRLAADEAGTSDFVTFRRHLMILALVNLGGRRGEIGMLKVPDIKKALRQKDPMLTLPTFKRGGGSREVPVSRPFLQKLDEYIELWRAPLVEEKLGDEDHGYLFVSAVTAKHLSCTTITNEISDLRKIAQIEEQACAHMFRHAFITTLFVLLIERHKIENPEEFSRLMLDGQKLKAEVLKWTGGKTIDSLDTYINLAFEEVSGLKTTVRAVTMMRFTRLFLDDIDYEVERLQKTRDIEGFVSRFKKAVEGLRKDYATEEDRAERKPSSQR